MVDRKKYIIISDDDNVAVATDDICENNNKDIAQNIEKGHKFAIKNIPRGGVIKKYGYKIGIATEEIKIGQHVHSHNCKTSLDDKIILNSNDYSDVQHSTQKNDDYFYGYLRGDGQVGIRNEIWIIPTVGCVNNICAKIAKNIHKAFPNFADNIHFFEHQFGCSQLSGDADSIRTLMTSLISHPNAGGVLLVGLGCENNQGKKILDALDETTREKTLFYAAQQVGDEVEHGINLIAQLIAKIDNQERVKQPISKLRIAIKCGGSDGFSGLSANPLVGRISDKLETIGAGIIMGEVPEIFGAEDVILSRCKDANIRNKFIAEIEKFKDYFIRNNVPVYENPSPGNKAGGITTLEEKSLGAVQKAGHATLNDILQYGGRVHENGLNLVITPGNDGVSSTAFAASGAHVILFTTGRGTPMGFPVPTLKISSNSELAQRKPGWIDFDAGRVLENGDFDQISNELFELIIDIANGKQTKNEINDERDIAIWKNGVTL